MPAKDKIEINGIRINDVNYSDMLDKIQDAVKTNTQLAIAYANANTVNICYLDKNLVETLNSFDIVHPDGIGVYKAIKYLYGDKYCSSRFTGSDFYHLLASNAIKNDLKIFFFGHDDKTLSKIKINIPELKISGLQNGYRYESDKLIDKINNSNTDILMIGTGTPNQERWVINNRSRLRCKVIICCGDGIKVFAGSKIRGPKFIRNIGMEWFVRFLLNPFRFFKRYAIGNPLFLYRIYRLKMRKLAE